MVVAILGVMAALAWGSLRDNIPRYRLISASRELAEDVANLRMLAITSNREARLVLEEFDPDGSDPDVYGGAWRLQAGDASTNSRRWEDLPIDADVDGSDDQQGGGPVDLGPGGNRESPGVGLATMEALRGPGTGNGNAVVFTPRGWLSNPAGDFDANGYITLRLVNKSALSKGYADEVYVRIARSGYVRLESTASPESGTVGTSESSTHGS